jgi:hypothetical protein
MKKLFALCLLAAAFAFSAYGQTKNQDIARLLKITNTESQASQMFDLMLPSLELMAPQVPDEFWAQFKSKLDLNSFSELLVPIYDRHFSQDDIRGLIQFYESPIGKRMLEVTPLITQESFAAGQEWGQKIGQEVVNELVKQGYF